MRPTGPDPVPPPSYAARPHAPPPDAATACGPPRPRESAEARLARWRAAHDDLVSRIRALQLAQDGLRAAIAELGRRPAAVMVDGLGYDAAGVAALVDEVRRLSGTLARVAGLATGGG